MPGDARWFAGSRRGGRYVCASLAASTWVTAFVAEAGTERDVVPAGSFGRRVQATFTCAMHS